MYPKWTGEMGVWNDKHAKRPEMLGTLVSVCLCIWEIIPYSRLFPWSIKLSVVRCWRVHVIQKSQYKLLLIKIMFGSALTFKSNNHEYTAQPKCN